MKKLLLTLGTSVAVLTPIASVIACGDDNAKTEIPTTPETPGTPGTPAEIFEDFTIDYTIDARTDVATTRSTTKYEINITGFDKTELSTLTGLDITLGSFHLMNQIIRIVKDNNDKDITGVTVNGTRIDQAMEDEDREYFGHTFQEMIDFPAAWDMGAPTYMGMFNLMIANAKGKAATSAFTPVTLTYLDAFWGEFKTALGIEDLSNDAESTLADYGVSVSDTKLVLNAVNFGFLTDTSNGFANISEASFYASFGINFSSVLEAVEPSDLAKIKSIEFDSNGTKKEVMFNDVIGSETLVEFVVGEESEDYQAVIDVDATNTDYDLFFDAYSKFDDSEGGQTVDEWRESSKFDNYSEKSGLLLFKLLMQYYK